ncbi:MULTISPECIES: putative bifunctional diguanylate cyclase/phosphodiesterase [Alteromonadaceae]|uniref:putative bifunctional diguanylate cyclase/phosphodiesterase n=1 Tax=Alteromonadaceae TaxID=72275 RepID=UPI001C081F5E|nr:EAL domain-containing protein [Aliiglaciecola lipolytica]MBU2879084.1 EAL domain-containing protein [Aliiglaciecola lipolytica]
MSFLWLQKTNQDFILKQQEIKHQNQSQYLLLNKIFGARIESWVEMLVQLHQNEPEPIQALAKTLSSRFEFLQLNMQVEEGWLFDSQKNLMYSSESDIPPHILKNTEYVFENQSPKESTFCVPQCSQILSIPLFQADGSVAVITLSLSLIDTLAFLNQSTDATLALVYVSNKTEAKYARDFRIREPLAVKHFDLFEPLIDSFPAKLTIDKLTVEGAQLNINNKHYFAVVIPMSTVNADDDYILAAYDITPMMLAHRAYQQTILITASVVFVLAMLLFYLITNSVRQRLIDFSERLPLLALREYQQFRLRNRVTTHYFKDELDTLNASANKLADRLEQLDNEVLTKANELEKMAMYDQLTNLPNRNMLVSKTKEAVAKLVESEKFVVLMMFDLDDFKKVNDSYGHTIGDELLREAAARFQSALDENGIVCRLGGDEFAILLNNVEDIKSAIKVAEKLLDRFRAPINVAQLRFYVSTSVGFAHTSSAETNVNELIRCADIAMYHAKNDGGNCIKLYIESMSKNAIDKVALEDEARIALINDNFSFSLQPQIELKTGRLVGFEALLRWNHPDRGPISPGDFIPILENTEFMLTLGYWCIENAFSLLQTFKQQGYPDLKIAINLAGIQFLDPDLVPYLEEKIKSSGLKPSLIELELTERTLVSDIQRTNEIMQRLIDKGFLISIDDFGTGYSSLSYLKTMPANFIKIDRAFIDGMLSNDADRQIVAATVSMVQNLKMKVIAEGIEEQLQIDLLKQFDCNMAQGFYIAKPIPEDLLFEELQKYCKNGIWQYGQSH